MAATLAKDSELFAEPAEGAPPSAYLQSPLEDDPLLMCVSPEDEDWARPAQNRALVLAARTLNAKRQSRVTLSLR